MQSLQILQKLMADHQLQSQAKHDRVMAEWLAAKCDAMCLKVRYYLHGFQLFSTVAHVILL